MYLPCNLAGNSNHFWNSKVVRTLDVTQVVPNWSFFLSTDAGVVLGLLRGSRNGNVRKDARRTSDGVLKVNLTKYGKS